MTDRWDAAEPLLVPAKLVEDRYVGATDRECWIEAEGLPESYIAEHFNLVHALTEVNGRITHGSVLVPSRIAGESAYVLLFHQAEDEREQSGVDRLVGVIDHYLFWVCQSFQSPDFNEFDPDTSVMTRFVEPTLAKLDRRGDREAAVRWEELHRFTRAIVCGEAGAGKTTCLRRLAVDLARSGLDETGSPTVVPVYLALRTVVRSDATWMLSEDVLQHALQQQAVALAPALPELIGQGRLLLLLDGLDELPAKPMRRAVLDSVHAMCERWPTLKVVLSTRDAAQLTELPDFTRLAIEPFDDNQMAHLSYLALAPGREWKPFVRWTLADESVKSVVRNPLALVFAATLFARSGTHAFRPAHFMASWANLLLTEWDASRGILRREDEEMDVEGTRKALSRIAYLSLVQGGQYFTERQISEWLPADSDLGILEVARNRADGLLREVSPGVWGFPHEGLWDYLAAEFIIHGTDSLERSFPAGVSSPRWQNVWLMACELSSDASGLLQLLGVNSGVDVGLRSLLLLEALARGAVVSGQDVAPLVDRAWESVLSCERSGAQETSGQGDEANDPTASTSDHWRTLLAYCRQVDESPGLSDSWRLHRTSNLDPVLLTVLRRSLSSG